jgi:hypothetical protein
MTAPPRLSWDIQLAAPLPSFPDSTDLPWEPRLRPCAFGRNTHAATIFPLGQIAKVCHRDQQQTSQSAANMSSLSSGRLSQRALFDLVWTYDNAALDALSSHIERILAVRRLGPEAYAESRIVDLLDNLLVTERTTSDGISISILRARIPEVARPMFDHALLRLENRGIVTLLVEDARHEAGHDW